MTMNAAQPPKEYLWHHTDAHTAWCAEIQWRGVWCVVCGWHVHDHGQCRQPARDRAQRRVHYRTEAHSLVIGAAADHDAIAERAKAGEEHDEDRGIQPATRAVGGREAQYTAAERDVAEVTERCATPCPLRLHGDKALLLLGHNDSAAAAATFTVCHCHSHPRPGTRPVACWLSKTVVCSISALLTQIDQPDGFRTQQQASFLSSQSQVRLRVDRCMRVDSCGG
eukprot:COSAG01_NODE_16_length_40091_cov_15.728646_26_plen_224_part_00